ncbi:MAG: ABC transporter ATP-binding protein [Deltaproteobacteria bacterium]|nr:ABC transporter ATP-binding protein [Deltaproteobacteria bacterium]
MVKIRDAFKGVEGEGIDPGHCLIKGRCLCKSFHNSRSRIDILKSVDLEIGWGETLAIVGASGIGKSTLLNILGTLDRPDCGELFFKGENVLLYDDEKLARFRNVSVGFVFQFHHLLPEFSALENTMMPALIRGDNKAIARESAEAILLRVGLGDRLHHRVVELSGGEQQRVALARALVLKPPVLLADEPTGNLDKRNSEKVHELLLELNQEFQMTLVVVTHNLELAALMSRIVTILDGKLVETD